jgi:hypothetical protein
MFFMALHTAPTFPASAGLERTIITSERNMGKFSAYKEGRQWAAFASKFSITERSYVFLPIWIEILLGDWLPVLNVFF